MNRPPLLMRRRAFAIAFALPCHVFAGKEPVYVSRDGSGRLFYTNEPLEPDAAVLLIAGSAEVQAFRRQFRRLVDVDSVFKASPLQKSRFLKGRMAELHPLIERIAKLLKVEANLIRAIITVESGFNARARSTAGAVGLMQLMPATARRYGVTDREDPAQNVMAGARYLKDLLAMFAGDVRLALAGYNAGEGNVMKHGRRIPPFAETQKYVPAVLAVWRVLREGQ